MRFSRFIEALPTITMQNPGKKARVQTVTCSVRIEQLRCALLLMIRTWSRITTTKAFKNSVLGFARNIEVTRGKEDRTKAQVHFHVLLLLGSENTLWQPQWAELWRKGMGADYNPDVRVRRVQKSTEGVHGTPHKAIVELLFRTFKYSIQSHSEENRRADEAWADMTTDLTWLYEYADQVHKLKLVAGGGVFKEAVRTRLLFDGESKWEEIKDHKRPLLCPIRRYRRRF